MKWRYIPPFSARGDIQMAVDAWLFEQSRLGQHPPTFRFYTWHPATLSLGHFQKTWPDHWNHLTWQGYELDLVRRPSGGRGVLHQGDLTYSLTMPIEGYSRREAYVFLCQFLIQGWQKLGVNLNFGKAGRGYHKESNCFRLATGADLVTETGIKLIGSAQLWRGNHLLQHGSMSINPAEDLKRLVFPEESAPETAFPKAVSQIDLADLIDSLTQAIQTCLNIEFEISPFSNEEWRNILEYVPAKPVLENA